ncbi:MAG: hypothetical protein ACK5AO_02200 [bacterium]|jgi:hypothetical protein
MKFKVLNILITLFVVSLLLNGCSRRSSLNRKSNIGAERLMSGEKVPRMKKFKS